MPTVLLVLNGGPGTLAAVVNAAYSATPIVILADTGGAATALYLYSQGQIDTIPANFQSKLHLMEQVFKLHNTYDQKLVRVTIAATSNTLATCSWSCKLVACLRHAAARPRAIECYPALYTAAEPVWAARVPQFFKLGGELRPPSIQAMLLEATLDMLGAPAAWARLPVGASVEHAQRGPGVITAILPDGRRELTFPADLGKTHKYHADSMFKLSFRIDDCTVPHEWTSHPLLKRALMLCVAWEMPVLVHKAIANSHAIPPEGAGTLPAVRTALQRALELQRFGVTRELMCLPGIRVGFVNMCRLYTLACDSSAERAIFTQLSPSVFDQLTAFSRLSSVRELTPRQEHRAYQNIVGPLLKSVLEPMNKMVLSS